MFGPLIGINDQLFEEKNNNISDIKCQLLALLRDRLSQD